ncbi:M15 family metallopeptidase [Piscirickettsia salmonis]|uniref:M15 family metallopeptidase n=1 Tax=Piscirickettsia salmonis TaxID=1238 RepID=UPI000F0998DB|nr:D-Ala-D-Ala dipeptidase [Piscirickettsiaceae bacterium NZ-RLO2]
MLTDLPICHNYKTVDKQALNELQQQAACVELKPSSRVICLNEYYQQKLPGALSVMYTRQSVYLKLLAVLENLAPHFAFAIFDAYRSVACQKTLFEQIYRELCQMHPGRSKEWLEIEVRKYVSHPHEPSRFAVPPHNSGGAIDLTLMDLRTNTALDFGTEFDNTTTLSQTDYFERDYSANLGISSERWLLIRQNRRLLFNTMKQEGFTNFVSEWWHYDLGDCLWADAVGSSWFYDSMEAEVN